MTSEMTGTVWSEMGGIMMSEICTYELLRSTDISLNIYDLFGQEVYRADIRRQGIGSHVLNWQAENEISGIYYYRLSFGNEFVSGSFVLKN